MFEPMNACILNPKKREEVLNSEYYAVQRKLKGMRALLFYYKDNLTIISRGGKEIALPHFRLYKNERSFILDCELYNPEWDDAVLCGVVHRQFECKEKKQIIAAVFDILALDDVDIRRLTLSQRLKYLDQLYAYISKINHGVPLIVEPIYRGDKDFKLSFYNDIVSKGGEGVIFKNLDAIYVSGKRPANNWYKMKYTEVHDCIIVDYVPGEGKYKGLIGALVYGQIQPSTGNLVVLGTVSGFNDSLRKDMTENFEKYKGRVIEIKAMGRTSSGALEHPVFVRFRDDKRPEECYMY